MHACRLARSPLIQVLHHEMEIERCYQPPLYQSRSIKSIRQCVDFSLIRKMNNYPLDVLVSTSWGVVFASSIQSFLSIDNTFATSRN